MKDIIYEVLNLIEKSGFECYIVGGYVRDKILGIESKDIDIITNAKPKDLFSIFKGNAKIKEDYGAVKLIINEYHIDITTYRKDFNYKNNKPLTVEYISDVYEDLKRRDFTMNTLLMNKEGKIIDLMDSIEDVSNKVIKVVGDVSFKFNEDATRILRALRFMTTLGFELDDDITKYINNNKNKLKDISYFKRKEELDRIFGSPNLKVFLNYIKKYDLEESLGIRFNKIVFVPTIMGIWAQIDFDKEFPFNNNERKQINDIKYLVNKKDITKYDVYKYGNYIVMRAAAILKKSSKKYNKIYTSLPIKCIMDIDISCDEICHSLNIKPSKKVGEIYKLLEKDIIDGKVKNIKNDLIKYIKLKEK